MVATNLAIDPDLLNRALEVGGASTKKETVTLALREFIARRERAKIVGIFNTIEWDDSFDFKADRARRDQKHESASS